MAKGDIIPDTTPDGNGSDGEAPPPYQLLASDNDITRGSNVTADGRVDVDLNSRLARNLAHFVPYRKPRPESLPPYVPPAADEPPSPLRLNIVIQVVGSRGDVQPFIALGTALRQHGHRVRLATHSVFATFVRSSGLEFFSIGGDPSELMAYMVKNPGLMPSMKSLREGDVQKKRTMVREMLEGGWAACIMPDEESGRPFVADAIIANPPSFMHVHCAQALGVPLHLMFTMPWTRTREMAHPLANLMFGDNSGLDKETANYVSHCVVEWMTWQGLGDVINDWRRAIDLEEVPMSEGANMVESLKIPFTYCWSPALVPKPLDWPDYIDVCGFFFRKPPSYTPDPELRAFLDQGPTPIYIGFGSIVLDDPEKMTRTILEAVEKTGVRAIISRGWSNLGEGGQAPKGVLWLGDCPHEWLFTAVSAVIHHGGAGTTACGLANGRPTLVVPFFGDQPFWGDMVERAGAGPRPIPQRQITAQNLADAICFLLTPEASAAAADLAAKMRTEDGVSAAVRSFHANLPLDKMRCDILPDQPAVWHFGKRDKQLKISKLAEAVLRGHIKIDKKSMSLHESRAFVIENQRWDPITGASSALLGITTDMVKSTSDIFVKPVQIYQQRSKERSATGRASGSASPTRAGSSRASSRPGSAGSGSSTAKHPSTAAAMAAGSASGVGGFFKAYGKGFYVDLPLAIADGGRAVPRLYGQEVRERAPITDWKSGAVEGGKNFVQGIAGGMADLVVQPYKGAKEKGALGAVTGIGKGVTSMAAKTISAAVGVVAYPGQGIYKSIRTAVHSKTRGSVMEARRAEGDCMKEQCGQAVVTEVLAEFDRLRYGKQLA